MTVVHEVEHTFAVNEAFRVPPFDGVPGVDSIADRGEKRLDAVYFDTDDLRLARNRMTLRRREGGDDAGWHLKIPTADGARDEIGRPLGEAGHVPDDLVDLVAVRIRGAELHPVARVTTVRRVRRLRDAAGHDLLEVADDEVNARTMGRRTIVSRWREIEIEALDPAAVALLPAAGEILREAGARPAVLPSKLRRALAVDVGRPDLEAERPRPTASATAGEVIHAYLVEHTAALLDNDPGVRIDAPESVHDMRVAARRLRSTVQTFRPLFDAGRAGPIEAGLREIGEVLGEPRDAEVLLAGFTRALAEQPVDMLLGPVRARVQETFLGERLRAREAALDYLRGSRYLAFIEELLAFVGDAEQTDLARRRARAVLPKLVAKADRRLTRRVDRARAITVAGAERDIAYHGARKAAKRLRYACELMEPVAGRDAVRLAKRARRVQNELGEHHDSVVALARLRRLAVSANLAGESSFTYGLLAGQERARAGTLLTSFETTWADAGRPRLRRWLRRSRRHA